MKRFCLKSVLAACALCLAFIASAPAIADVHEMHDAKAGAQRSCKVEGSWRETLTSDQKARIDRAHLELKKDTGLIKARLGVKKAELKELLVQDNPDVKAIDQKISDVAGLKKEIMQKRARHILEMRRILTPEQRVSFDAAIMRGSKAHWEHGD